MACFDLCSRLHQALVCYRDYGDEPRLEIQDFVEKEGFQALQVMLDRLEAFGGDDAAEDIAGALDVRHS